MTNTLRLTTLIGLLCSISVSALSQNAPDPSAAMVGAWELSNAERDKTCNITFKLDPAGAGHAMEFASACAELFPETREVTYWVIGRDEALRFIDAKGKAVLEFIEVENGLFEPLHPGTSIYFLQTAAEAQGKDRTADQMFGDWAFARSTGRQICQMSLLNTAADPESFALSLKPGCDNLITAFAPKGWRMDRGLFMLLSERGEPWRFEEADAGAWRRIPAGRTPLLLVKP